MPTWEQAGWVDGNTAVALRWSPPQSELHIIVLRQVEDSTTWLVVSAWLPPGTLEYRDETARPTETYFYQLRVMDSFGQTNTFYRQMKLSAPNV